MQDIAGEVKTKTNATFTNKLLRKEKPVLTELQRCNLPGVMDDSDDDK